ncbi:MAG TPA: NAD-glutamate dehydrogenase [Streptosporangiaceae bacterium]|jgi:glutamate dehydrogenase|nr:NAD-glutamate dehydrogenase [Streptosporangiaceae bacterium]
MTDISGGKKSLLAQAAQAARTDTGVGDVPRFLDAYYRHVAAEDLAEAGAERMAAVAMEQAAFAALRPQGRPLVRVRAAGQAALEPTGTTVDIVTDDMPYLVDSVLMAVHRCGLEVHEVVHPQLRVIRDVGGTMHGVLGVSDGSPSTHDEIKESWIHLEMSALAGAAEAAALGADLERVLGDVRAAVEDYPKMHARALTLADSLARAAPPADEDAGSAGEVEALLRWLADGHFTFLGYREYDLVDGPDGMQLSAVPGTGLGILRHDRQASSAFAALPPEVRAKATEPRLLILTKANSMSTVHRPHYLDYVAVKRFGPDGKVTGEQRFLGLYTHSAYSESITRIPVLRRKLAGVLAATGLAADSHDGNDLAEFLENYPREELFQIPVPDLIPVADGVLRLRDRKQTRLFLRKDPYGRYMSCLVYMPRDRYTTGIRLRAQEILRQALGGESVSYSVMVGESAVSRLHIVVRAGRGKTLPDADEASLERQLVAAIRSWDDDLAEETRRVMGAAGARSMLALCDDAIPDTYKADVPAAAAASDLARIAALRESGEDTAFELWESEGFVGGVPAGTEPAESGPASGPAASEQHAPRVWRLTIYRTQSPLTLTDVLPRLQHMGVDVVDEHPYEFAANGGKSPFWIYDFGLRRSSPGGAAARPAASLEAARPLLEGALDALWHGRTEDDDFNALVLDAALTWRQVVVLRGYARYLRQAGTSFSQNYIARVLRSNVTVTRLLVKLFESRFDPDRRAGQSERSEAIAEEISGELDEVASLDQDRILRAVWALIRATLRTNYFQDEPEPGAGLPYFAVKLDPAQVPDLPAPRPRFELFVYSPRFEGVHLRFAHVARGGLRWSERPEDFRTEVLGLAKAQEVKNSVIVPSGAKGGFVCKHLPASGDRDAVGAEVLTCYKMFISAMLDITDNLSAGKVVPPPRVARHDGDDPYLVVAADKGTATFSDTANEIATGYGFWLGDAFASGGSDGYDHKKMGITARGAWESVKFGFQTLGLDTAAQDFTVVGIGDMSGDVFGNGMLRSEHIRLIAAFDHRHVFIDPDPDPAASFAERARLFALPRSSWADYDPALISAGGGVFPRTAKSVRLTPEAAAVLGLDSDATSLTPDQLVSAILAAPVDLLWNGGIGTYVKASNQSHADVGDRSNDSVRVDATALRARVVGEGGNLGLTQEARIEYALAGGLVNTDFIDNSAGVDTSDHEVNMKIVLAAAMDAGDLSAADRSRLLHEMTDEVAALVLAHNYQQNRTLALARAQAPSMLHVHARYIRKLERDRRVHRRLDVLPGDRELAERRSAGAGLTVPEFSVLLAHTKIATAQDVLASDVPDDPYLRRVLTSYFPAPMRERFADLMPTHRLHREIITTVVVNDMIDRSGITSLFRQAEETGASIPDLTRAWLVARDVLQMPDFWAQVEALDGQVDTSVQIQMLLEGRKLTERAVRWLVANRRPPFGIQPTVDFFADGMAAVAASVPKRLAGRDVTGFEERRSALTAKGVPADLADRVSAMVPGYSAFDIVQVARSAKRPVEEAAEVYFDLSDRLQIGRLRDRITALPRDDRWSTMARGALRDDLYTAHAALAKDVLMVTGSGGAPEQRLLAWARRNESAVIRAGQTLTEIWESDVFTVAMLSVAVRAIRTLVSASRLPD